MGTLAAAASTILREFDTGDVNRRMVVSIDNATSIIAKDTTDISTAINKGSTACITGHVSRNMVSVLECTVVGTILNQRNNQGGMVLCPDGSGGCSSVYKIRGRVGGRS